MQTDSEKSLDTLQSLTAIEQYFVQIGNNDSKGLMHLKSVLRFHGKLDVRALENAINILVEQNQALRTSFSEVPGVRANRPRLVRVINPASIVKLEIRDFSDQSTEQKLESIQQVKTQEHKRQFDLERGPLCHFTLVKSTERELYLFITLHHAISDVWSLNVLIKEIAKHYNASHADPAYVADEKSADLVDYLEWYNRQASTEAQQKATNFWAKYLSGFTGNDLGQDLSVDVEAIDFQAEWAEIKFALPEKLSDFSKRNALLSFAAPLLAYGMMLSTYAKSDNLYILHTISGRFSPAFNNVVGLLVRMLLQKIAISPGKTAKEAMKELQIDFLSALPHGAIPILSLLPGLTRVDRMHHRFWTDLSQPKILFNFLHIDNEPVFESLFNDLQCEHILPHDSDNALNDINLFMRCEGTQVHGWLGCWKSRYTKAVVQEMAEAYQRLLVQIVSNPDRRMSEFMTS